MSLPADSPIASAPGALPAAPAPADVVAVPRRRRWRSLLVAFLMVCLLVAAGLGYVISQGGWFDAEPLVAAAPASPSDGGPKEQARQEKLARKMASLAPTGIYVLVDTYKNRIHVFKNGEPLREAVCSTGSGTILKDPEKGREWVFDTPRGERKVQRKVKNPIWVKPDWAFIEEGYRPPGKDSPGRYDDFSLGDYGLYLGDGYIMHGTVFQSLLGQRVTHGCIRIGDADLEWIYNTVPLGTRVYLF